MISHCEWRPIEELDQWSGDKPVYAWDRGELVEIVYSRNRKEDEFSWGTTWSDGYDTYHDPISPQPKYYLAVTPPPED